MLPHQEEHKLTLTNEAASSEPQEHATTTNPAICKQQTKKQKTHQKECGKKNKKNWQNTNANFSSVI